MRVAISACLMGRVCRYDGSSNRNDALLKKLENHELIPFCPEDHAFGTPRPTMDLIETGQGIRAICNETGSDQSDPIITYAKTFFDSRKDIDLYIGKDRSPSCGVCSARLYDADKILLSDKSAGLMSRVALERGVVCSDAEKFVQKSQILNTHLIDNDY